MTQHENYGGDDECQCAGHHGGNHDEGGYWCCKCTDEADAEMARFAAVYAPRGKLVADSIHRPVTDEEREEKRRELLEAGR